MKAVICTKYGGPEVLQLQEVEKPVPKDNEILVRIHAVPVNYGDLLVRKFNKVSPREFNMPMPLWFPTRLVLGISKPSVKILGSEFSGEIKSTGQNVSRFKQGDPVFGYLAMKMGTNAEYLCMSEKGCVALKPSNMSHEQAAGVPYGAITAMKILARVNIRSGKNVLVIGASGGIGSAAVQFCKNAGAAVTGVCGTPRLEFVKALGADKVIDYTKENFAQSGETYDLIVDILGRSPAAKCKRALKPNGTILYASFKTGKLLQMLLTKITGGKRVICAMASESAEALDTVRGIVESGKFKSIIDKTFPLEQTAGAHRYIEQGNKKGNVIITLK
jgi:NADPH:quinone reductase-like Zn-dependent oxidoreductase